MQCLPNLFIEIEIEKKIKCKTQSFLSDKNRVQYIFEQDKNREDFMKKPHKLQDT